MSHVMASVLTECGRDNVPRYGQCSDILTECGRDNVPRYGQCSGRMWEG